MEILTTTAISTLLAILKIFLVIIVAGYLVRRRIMTDAMVTALTKVSILLFLPCLILDKIIANFRPSEVPLWWTLPLASVGMTLVGLALAGLIFARELPAKRAMLALASMQNAGYLILPVGLALYPEQFDEFALYCFLFILGFNPILWSVGKLLTTAGTKETSRWNGLLNPPLVACLGSVTLVLTGVSRVIPRPVLDAVELIGQGTVPVATVVLGGMLGGMTIRFRNHIRDTLKVLTVKYGLLPAATVVFLLLSGIGDDNPLLARFLVLESASAPAVGLILQVRAYGGDEEKVGTVMLVSYLACVASLPFWLAIWELVGR